MCCALIVLLCVVDVVVLCTFDGLCSVGCVLCCVAWCVFCTVSDWLEVGVDTLALRQEVSMGSENVPMLDHLCWSVI